MLYLYRLSSDERPEHCRYKEALHEKMIPRYILPEDGSKRKDSGVACREVIHWSLWWVNPGWVAGAHESHSIALFPQLVSAEKI